nr:NAD(P)H-dependent oxidoreductase [uncultured Ruminococcus sp.]
MTLYINCCVREESRTERLAQAVLQKLGGDFTELNLYNENLKPLDGEMLNKRTALIEQGDYSDPMFDYAKQFASADTIVIAAPYWDLSFPASLKTYIENIYVTGIVSAYNESGLPVGLCKATELYYVTTAGGPYDPTYSYGYIESLAKNFFGIPKTHLVKAEMLDLNYSCTSETASANGCALSDINITDILQSFPPKKGALLPWGSDNF